MIFGKQKLGRRLTKHLMIVLNDSVRNIRVLLSKEKKPIIKTDLSQMVSLCLKTQISQKIIKLILQKMLFELTGVCFECYSLEIASKLISSGLF